jgi:hypothetical protein
MTVLAALLEPLERDSRLYLFSSRAKGMYSIFSGINLAAERNLL